MKKFIVAAISVLVISMMTVSASAAEIPTSYDADQEAVESVLGTPIAAYTLDELDTIAASHGYTSVKPYSADSYRQYEAEADGILYIVCIGQEQATRSANQLDSEIGGAIAAYPILVDEDNILLTELDVEKDLFGDVVSMNTIDESLVKDGFERMEFAPVIQYLKGDENTGVNITIIGDDLRVFCYGEVCELYDFNIAEDGFVSSAVLSLAGAF